MADRPANGEDRLPDLDVFRANRLGVPHGFFGRRGGVSTGEVASLNAGLGASDDAAAVARNRALAVAAVTPGTTLVTPFQTHSADVVVVDTSWSDAERPAADALVTDRPELALGIVTADCAPVLLADTAAGVIAAAHAGWKGALSGIIDATVAAMTRLGGRTDRIVAAIGPCIARASYEVDEAFLRRFTEADAANERFFAPGRAGRHRFDLEAYVASRLAAAGLRTITALGLDTYADAERFYSYRRATHRGAATYGRQISLITLPH